MKTIRTVSLALPFLLSFNLLAQLNSPIRIAIGDTLKESMTIGQILSKPFFKAYHISGTPNIQYRITKLTLIIKTKTGEIEKYELQETKINSNTDPVKIIAPKIEGTNLDVIKKLKPGDKITLHQAIILPPDAGGTVIRDTEITIR